MTITTVSDSFTSRDLAAVRIGWNFLRPAATRSAAFLDNAPICTPPWRNCRLSKHCAGMWWHGSSEQWGGIGRVFSRVAWRRLGLGLRAGRSGCAKARSTHRHAERRPNVVRGSEQSWLRVFDDELNRIRQTIVDTPKNWPRDHDNPDADSATGRGDLRSRLIVADGWANRAAWLVTLLAGWCAVCRNYGGGMGMKNVCVLVPTTNAAGKRDVTGAFEPEARRYARLMRGMGHTVSEHRVDNTRAMRVRRKQALSALGQAATTAPLDVIALFCHGWRNGVQHGFTRATLDELVTLPLSNEVLFVLYCCSTGQDTRTRNIAAPGVGDRSFADTLRDKLCVAQRTDCRVVAHTTVAHTTKNPHVLFFEGLGSPVGGLGGLAPVTPTHALWRRWKNALRTDDDFRFRFPAMTVAEIHTELLQDT